MTNKCSDCTNCSGFRRSLEKRVFCSIEACVSGMVFGLLELEGKASLGLSSRLLAEKGKLRVGGTPVCKPCPSLPPECRSEFPSLPSLSCELRWSLQMVFPGLQPGPALVLPEPWGQAHNTETVDLTLHAQQAARFGVGMYLSCQIAVSPLPPPED